MSARHMTRRELVVGMMSIGVRAPLALAAGETAAQAPASAGLSHAAESIHQEVTLQASCRQVYEALITAQRFDALTRLSDAVTLLTAPGAQATAISQEVGGPFTLFGGYVTGRHLEMVPDQRLVQAWRAAGWPAGDYSVVKFALTPAAAQCRLVFDHRGFPQGQGASLAYGWRVHYWQPLAKLLAQG